MSASQPGWYQDPSGLDSLRFFDGREWTHLTAPVPADGQETPAMVAMGQQHMAGLHQAPAAPYAVPQGVEAPGGKTPRMVWWIGGVALAGIIGITAWSFMGSAGDKSDSVRVAPQNFSSDYQLYELGADFECDGLVEDVLRISSEEDVEGEIVVKISDARLTDDNRDRFAIPESDEDPESLAFECGGTATFDDGTTAKIQFELTVDYFEDMWVWYSSF